MQPLLHSIQLQILTLLMKQKSDQRYSQLSIPGIENDLFNYHLQILVKKGYIKKELSSYSLTELGKQEVSTFTIDGNPNQLFKVSVALAVFRNDYSEILVQKRTRNPFFGDITTIAGKVLPGEKIVDTARRKLLEEANLASLFTFIGVLRKIKRNSSRDILEDTFYHYCIATDPVGVISEKNSHGENFWVPSNKILEFESNNTDKAEYDLIVWERLLQKDFSSFYYEQDSVLAAY